MEWLIKANLNVKRDSISMEETKRGSLNLYLLWIMKYRGHSWWYDSFLLLELYFEMNWNRVKQFF